MIQWRRREVSPWENALVRWLLLLEGSTNQEILETLEEIAMQDPVLNKAMVEWEKSSDDPKVRDEYLARRKVVFDELAAVRETELKLEEAALRLREAILLGDQKAREAERIGRAKGEAEGKAEGMTKVAKNLLDMGFEISKVAQATGLSEEDVKRLRDN